MPWTRRTSGTQRAKTLIAEKTKRRGSEDEARKRIRDSHTQRKNDQAVFGIVPGLHGLIPVVERLDERASKAGEQSERSSNSRSARTHKKKCTLTSFEYEEKTSHPQDSAHAIFWRDLAQLDADSSRRQPSGYYPKAFSVM